MNEAPNPQVAVYCDVCVRWMNGPKQYESHSIGRKHRRWLRLRLPQWGLGWYLNLWKRPCSLLVCLAAVWRLQLELPQWPSPL